MIGELQLKESGTGLQPVIERTYEWGPDVSGSYCGLILIRQPLLPLQPLQTTANDSNQRPTSITRFSFPHSSCQSELEGLSPNSGIADYFS